ncbi:MAG: prolyl oligopeptidase family serine peptidase [Gammaproteobacteria bacterium]|jgi:prolyl oligopeptidase|nr:S9 family peptidase [Chromatiales bacterium]MDP6674958.1 prolyl oligopeptidase family serine peptidase [Gammaproteobacteria bacterium]
MPDYPESRRSDHVDDYHGTIVPDPYRWLEESSAPATQRWIAAQNALSQSYLSGLPGRDIFASRLREMIDYERFGIPQVGAHHYVYTYNTGQFEQDQLWITDDPAHPGRLLIDPNLLSADGTVSIGSYVLSQDGSRLAYSLSDGGSDWRSWAVLDVVSGQEFAERLAGIKFSDISWASDGQGFFYSRYPQSTVAGVYDDSRQVSVWYHKVDSPQSDDKLIYTVSDHQTRNPYGSVTEDGRFLVINLFDGYASNGVYLLPMEAGKPSGEPVRLLDAWDARYDYLGNVAERFIFKTTKDAPRGRIIEVDLKHPDSGQWRTLVAERAQAIESASLVGGQLVVRYIVDVYAELRIFSSGGADLGVIDLPGKGTVDGFTGRFDAAETFFSYTDFTTPETVYRFDLKTHRSAAMHAPELSIDPENYQSSQVFYSSKDGTQVPMTIVRRKHAPTDQPMPTVLYGYGGFNISLLPRYSTVRMAWLEAGGTYAVANIRGGGEYGEAWHEAGIKLKKQNVFDDFIAAAEWLIEHNYSTPNQLAIWGGSNGGLLVGAVAIQRPDLFAVAVPSVGVLDMLRYHTSSANARQWSSDYGLSENPTEFNAQYAYSPVHNLQVGTCYPSTLVMADANDDRVAPWNSYKYAAALQYAQGCTRPTLIRIETRSGHGAGSSTTKTVNQYADQWAFVANKLGLKIPGRHVP